MKKSIALIFAVFSLALLPRVAQADTVTMTFTGGGTTSGPEIVGPYQVTIENYVNGTPAGLNDETVMCLDLANSIEMNESWSATPNTVTSSSSTLDLEQAFLFNQLSTNPGSYSNSDYQYAIWGLNDLSGVQADGMDSASVQALDALAVSAVAQGTNASAYEDGQYTIYAAIPGSQASGYPGTAQDMIGVTPPTASPVPEPSSLMLFGSGMLGMAGIVRRKMAKA
ncbi:PEP-CTERM sorting domain-containing protein [Edaphobacter dinghuensis]|uniref:Ice-binding protein C-terminal domain-containing protein n=1 Tax=Edaphobacter dinghuensis TaxID=1560005 RepID=A0A917H8R8_9BACT|nr:PEP-CTERM sorting domain-containing protein [Edaphobacter dinghuensis]GGG71139.1 hypothetical protein GCM10011585_11690 [Edaphobacter dinghuensis]